MELTGDVVIGARRAQVWAALNDPAVLAACIPGCEAVDQVSPSEKTARMMVKVGPVRARFSGRILMNDVVEAERCAMSFEGSGGAAGMARGQSQVTLSDDGENTRLQYTVQASVGGKLGQVGGRMIDAAAKQMADQFFNAFQSQLGATPGGLPADSAAPSAPQAHALAGAAEDMPPSAAVTPASASLPVGAAVPRPADSTEWLRVKWFALGVVATTVGVWLGSNL